MKIHQEINKLLRLTNEETGKNYYCSRIQVAFLPGFAVTWNEEEQRDEKSIEAVSGSCTEETETNIDLKV